MHCVVQSEVDDGFIFCAVKIKQKEAFCKNRLNDVLP